MGSAYVDPSEYTAYGVSTAAQAQIGAASALIDAFLQRPEGLVWTSDGNGAPCFMSALSASMSWTAPGSISPGASVVVPITGGMTFPDLIGEVLILDRATTSHTEAVVVTAITASSITLASVAFSHSAPSVLEMGLVISEQKALPANRSVTRVSRSPVARMIAVSGRYAYGRRSQQQSGIFAEPSILASVQAFGGPPIWYPVDVNQVSVSPIIGEVWVPPGLLVANFSDVRMRYVAGYPKAGIPAPVKWACVGVATQLANFPEMAGSIKTLQAGQTKIEKFADNLLDADTRGELAPFSARAFA